MAGPSDMTVFELMKSRMQMLAARQKAVSQNVANVSTPGYVPHDVDMQAFSGVLDRVAGKAAHGALPRTAMMQTDARHLAGPSGAPAGVTIKESPDSETTLDGNEVVVEEQMMRLAETRSDFETMVGLYQRSLSLLHLAIRSPTR